MQHLAAVKSQLNLDPSQQGKGLGRIALSRYLEERCDAEGAPAVLVTSKERNVSFYEGSGFRVARSDLIGGESGFRMWVMVRDARR